MARSLPEVTSVTFLLFALLRSTASGDCPTECFCPETTSTTTCIGDRLLTALPLLNLSFGGQGRDPGGQGHRLELRDYMLPQLVIGVRERELFFGEGVTELVLAHNQIRNIVVDDLERDPEGSLTLTFLDLSNNNLTRFVSWAELSNCKSLDLSHNFLVSIMLSGMSKLESLNLRGNAIQILPENTFETLQSLHYINLDSNHLQTLAPHLFSPLPSLAHLILSNNPLYLPPHFILNSRSQFIDLSHLHLTLIPPSLTTNVRDLRLNNNQLKVIAQTDFESFPNLGLLVLDENQIEVIEDDALGRLEFLSGLWINGNRLTRIPQNLPSSLKSLQIEENQIQLVNQTDFATLHLLETLNLNANQLQTLDPEVFAPLTRLRTLMLRSNSLDSLLPSTFTNLTSLQILDLSQNPLKVIVNGAFDSVGSHLNVLHLSRFGTSDLQFDPAQLFAPFKGLQILDMSYSPFFCQRALQGLSWFKSLRELNVDACDLSVGHLKVLCDQILDIESLKIIKGAGNPFTSTLTHLTGLSILIPSNICPGPTAPSSIKSTTMTPPERLGSMTSTSLTLGGVTSTKVSLSPTSSPRRGYPPSSAPPRPQTTPNPSQVDEGPTSSYFLSDVNGDIGESEIGGGVKRSYGNRDLGVANEDRDEQGSIDGFPALTTVPDHHPLHAHHLPQKMLLQSPPVSARIPESSLRMRVEPQRPSPNEENLILKTILISALTCLLSVVLLLGLALALFRINGGRISTTTTRIETARHKAYERLDDKQEVELGISNRIYFTNSSSSSTTPSENTPQVFTIS